MSQIKLFFVPKTRATRPLWLLEELSELGAPFDWEAVRVDVAGGENRRPAYLAIHPHGHVPALLDGEQPIFESVAICLYLADRFIDRGLAPPFGSPLRGRYYQWAAYCPATLEPAIGDYMRHAQSLPELAAKAKAKFEEVAAVLTRALDGSPFLLGEKLSAVDILVAANLAWSRRVGLLPGHPVLESYVDRLLLRPAAQRAFSRS